MATEKMSLSKESLSPITSGLGAADEKYQKALAEITSALDARKNRTFDPVMLAMAQGFLAPTPTGSFGESLGQVAGNVGKAQQLEQSENLDLAKMRLQLAQSEREQAQRTQAAQSFRSVIGGQPPAAGGRPSAAGAAGAGAPMAGAAPTGGAPVAGAAPAGGDSNQQTPTRSVSVQDALSFAAAYPEQKELAKILMDAAKFESDRFKIAMNGTVFDTQTGRYIDLPIPGQKSEEFFIPELNGKLNLTPYEYSGYRAAKKNGQARVWLQEHMQAEPKPQAAVGAPSAGVKTVEQLAAEAEALKIEERAKAEGRGKRFENILTAAEDAGSRIATYKSLNKIVSQPDAEKMFGIFNRPDFVANLGKLIQSGVGVAGFSIGIPEIQNIMRNLSLPQDQINDFQVAGSLMAQMQLQISRLMQGQGAVSDFERQLFGMAGVTAEDNPDTIRKKLGMLTAKANFEREVSRGLRASKMNADDFKDSDKYQQIYESYIDRLQGIVSPGQRVQPAAPRPAAPPAGTFTPDSLRRRLQPQPS
jgi:hypothetical protein